MYAEARGELDRLVRELASEGKRRLPSEDDLSAYLGASRPTVRAALMSLEQEGKLQRLHGLGTFVNRLAVDVRANIAQDRPFLDVLRNLGHDASVSATSLAEVDASTEVLGRLRLDQPQPAWKIERLWLASGVPAVFAIDYIPSRYLCVAREQVVEGDSVFAFVAANTGKTVRYSIADLIPTVPDDHVAHALNVPQHSAVLLLLHTHVDGEDVPVAVTYAYLNDTVVRFSVVRQHLVSDGVTKEVEK
jgi:GntR family transcriptional regulator